jgi:preprotein translocase subunit SecG
MTIPRLVALIVALAIVLLVLVQFGPSLVFG